jgi:hypothetical protein
MSQRTAATIVTLDTPVYMTPASIECLRRREQIDDGFVIDQG